MTKFILFAYILFVCIQSARAFDLKSEVDLYQARYGLHNVYDKAVDNEGRGDSRLYGVRNFRVVLPGVYYRGGANNSYFKPPRPNSNPLPDVAVENLCKEGFVLSNYYYPTNYSSAKHETNCRDFRSEDRHFDYHQISALTFQKDDLILRPVFDRIRGKLAGPIYGHCWNGWHASGYAAAIVLRQFCGWSGDQAVKYWVRNTDGASAGNQKLKARIRSFRVHPDLAITPAEAALICPQ